QGRFGVREDHEASARVAFDLRVPDRGGLRRCLDRGNRRLGRRSRLFRVDASSGQITARPLRSISAPLYAGVSFGAGSLWAVVSGHVARIDPRTLRPVATISLPGKAAPWELTFVDGAVWVTA